MGMLDNTAKAMLVENMRKSLAKSVLNNKQLSESAVTESINYIAETATYEQLLNLSLNPLRESKYLPAYVLEGAAAILSSAMMTQRKVIGINAITEGAIRLQKKTGAVITESMLDAALEAAKGQGLHVVADCLKEAFAIKEAEAKATLKESKKPQLGVRASSLMESVLHEMTRKELMTRISDQFAAERNFNPSKKEITDKIREMEGGVTKKPTVHNASWQKKAAKTRKATENAKAAKAAKATKHAANKAGHDAAYQAGKRAGNRIGFESGLKTGTRLGKQTGYRYGLKSGDNLATKTLSRQARKARDLLTQKLTKQGNKKALAAAGATALVAGGLHAIEKWHKNKKANEK